MSTWTHVAIQIRLDSFNNDIYNHPDYPQRETYIDFDKYREAKKEFAINYIAKNNHLHLGNTVDYDDPQEKWDLCDVPCGSEGSLKYATIRNPKAHHANTWTISIWGDLRDYDNVREILEWLNKISNHEDYWVRQGIGSIQVDLVDYTIRCKQIEIEKFEKYEYRWEIDL